MLSLVGLGNVIFLLVSLHMLMVRLGHRQAAALGLVFAVFLWPPDAWVWSGFYHWRTLALVAPYPATFAAALGLWCLTLAVDKRWLTYTLASTICLLSHPTTALALFTVTGAMLLLSSPWSVRLRGAASVVAAVGLVSLWPYYSFFSLFSEQSADFNLQSVELYEHVIKRTWPVFALVPFIAWSPDRILLGCTAACTAMYIMGFFGPLGLGRMIAWAMLFAHLTGAVAIVRLRSVLAPAFIGMLVMTIGILRGSSVIKPLFAPPVQQWKTLTTALTPIKDDDVVMVDIFTASEVVAVKGRVVATYTPQYWVPDHDARRSAVALFFASGPDERRRIAEQYGVRWVFENNALRPVDYR